MWPYDGAWSCSPILEDIDISEAAKALWEAPFAVLSHDRFEAEEPVFTYCNKVLTAQAFWMLV